MKIALFSDVHANLPALEALFADLDTRNPDAVYCLGDLVGYNVWPNEVVNRIKQKGIPVITGNYDQGIGLGIDECGCAYKTEEDRAMGKISISYTNSLVGDSERYYLRTLPAHIRLDFNLNNTPFSVLLVHGSPRKVNEYLFEDRDEKSLWRIAEQAGADVLCFGHTHKPFHRILKNEEDGSTRYRHTINIGSVGKPKDGNPMGCYAILTLGPDTNVNDGSSLQVDFVRFAYDVERAARAIEESPLPDAYADMLRKGY